MKMRALCERSEHNGRCRHSEKTGIIPATVDMLYFSCSCFGMDYCSAVLFAVLEVVLKTGYSMRESWVQEWLLRMAWIGL